MPSQLLIAFSLFFFALGACVGSFLNVVIWRLPYRGREVLFQQKRGPMTLSWPPSHCPVCDAPIRWYQNIPVFSWLFLRARCANCKTSIPVRYPLVELGTALLFTGFFLAYFAGHWPTVTGIPLIDLSHDWPPFAIHLIFISALLAASAIDADLYIIPLSIPWFITIIGILSAIFFADPAAIPAISPNSPLARPVAGATIGLILTNLLLFFKILPRSFSEQIVEAQRIEAEAQAASKDKVIIQTEKGSVEIQPDTPNLTKDIFKKADNEQPLAPPPKLTRFKPSLGATILLLGLNGLCWYFLHPDYASLITVISAIAIFLLGVLPRDAGQLDVTDEVLEEISAPYVRREILKEIPFLVIPLACALVAHLIRIPIPSEPWIGRLLECFLGILVGGGLIWLIRIAGTLGFNKEAMGMGDAHLMAGIGAILGAPLVIIVVPIAAIVALAWAVILKILGKPNILPFGPWLSVGAILCLLIGNAILAWYFALIFPVVALLLPFPAPWTA